MDVHQAPPAASLPDGPPPRPTSGGRGAGWAYTAGIISVALGVAAGELTATAVSPSVSPLTAVGGAVIDVLPPGVKGWAISLFGTSDKLVFLISMCLVVAVLAAVAGRVEFRRRFAGVALMAVVGAVGLAAVATRADATAAAYAGPVVAAGVAGWLLVLLRNRSAAWASAQAGVQAPAGEAETAAGVGPGTAADGRRRFLRAVVVSAFVAVAAGTVAAAVRGTAGAVAAARAKLRLPAPSSSAPAIPPGAQLDVQGISPLVTPNSTFYRIDTALVVPSVNPDGWKLKVTGMVDHELELDLAALFSKPLIERYITIACVSNEVGGDLIGTAKWLGWPVRELLAEAGIKDGADMVLSTSTDGFSASTPLAAMTDSRDAMIAVGMNSELLPTEHGFPARLIVPGLYGFVSATKWLSTLKVTRFADDVAYWSTRGWSDHGPIKLSSRIDTPRSGRTVNAGRVQFGGMAWAQEFGISRVQLQVGDGNWQDARLAAGISKDTWYQWAAELDIPAGNTKVQVRAFDGQGNIQVANHRAVAPDGATGYHQITVHTS